MNKFPIYIPSKSRSEYMMTSKALTNMGVEHYVIVEPDQVSAYKEAVKSMELLCNILTLDMQYKNNYELCDKFGLSKSTGPGPARNFAWDHSGKNGHSWHWVMDDNIRDFRILGNRLRIRCSTPKLFEAMEDFCLRYKNIAMAGPNYVMFAVGKAPPFVINTRIYSCNLIRNDTGFRWRGRYNEDTILSLDMLTAGWCTVQFNAFLQFKVATQRMAGGNTKEFYHKEGVVYDGEVYADTGTDAKSIMLAKEYPNIAKVVKKFNRTHHYVDYTSFKKNKLIKNETIEIKDYKLKLVKKNG